MTESTMLTTTASRLSTLYFFFFNDTATTEIYTLSLHDALPISGCRPFGVSSNAAELHGWPASPSSWCRLPGQPPASGRTEIVRSEEHTSELQSRQYLVCRLLLEKKKQDTPASRTPAHRCTPTAS